ncbi:6571_t:CDS:2, partial [Funneliformis geosporum]
MYPENSELSRDIKLLNKVKRFSENLKSSHERQKQEKEIANTPPNICLEIDRNLKAERSRKEIFSDSLLGVFQRDHILSTNPVNEISEIVATTLDHDSDDNFSNTSDIIDYFKEEEGANDSIKRVLK